MGCTRLKKEREGKKKIQRIKMNNLVIGKGKGVREINFAGCRKKDKNTE